MPTNSVFRSMSIRRCLVVLFALSLAFALKVSPLAAQDPISETERMVDQGRFREAMASLDREDAPESRGEKERLREIMRRSRLEFPFSEAEVAEKVRVKLPDATDAQIEAWTESGTLESRVFDGERRYFKYAVPNLFRLAPELKVNNPKSGRWEWLSRLIAESQGDGALFHPVRATFVFSLEVPADTVPDGATVRCWMPVPHEGLEVQDSIEIQESDPDPVRRSDPSEPHSYLCMERKARAGEPVRFFTRFQYVSHARWYSQGYLKAHALPYDTDSELYRKYTAERPPHILKTERFQKLAREIVQGEENPVEKASLLFNWVDANVTWASSNEYGTMVSISENVLDHGRGDCGMKALLYISLLRCVGIPARWESGWLCGGGGNMHDWLNIYYEGIGWVPCDISFGRGPNPDGPEGSFYKAGRDPLRLIVNSDYGGEFTPRKIHYRSEPVDFQRGEVEWFMDGSDTREVSGSGLEDAPRSGNLYFPEWNRDIEASYEVLNPET